MQEKTNETQKKTFWILTIIGFIYFLVFIIPNRLGAKDAHMLLVVSGDENITYPYVLKMLTVASNLYDQIGNIFIYWDYHYGYPFYFFSTLSLLPVRLIAGEQFFELTQINLLVLRQMVSVLPMIAAVGIFVYLKTRFKSIWQSMVLFVSMLLLPAIVDNNTWWWHPDAYAILFIALTLLFLDRDNFKYGKSFYLAAAACGLSISTKMLGFWFVFTILGYLLYGLYQKKITFKEVVIKGAVFVVIMSTLMVLTNPFLFHKESREFFIDIQEFKTHELRYGYEHDDPSQYARGPHFWNWTIKTWFTPWWYLLFPVMSMIAGCIWGQKRKINLLFASWIVPYTLYVLFFVAPKPFHYLLPSLLPLFACILDIPDLIFSRYPLASWKSIPVKQKYLLGSALGLIAVLILFQIGYTGGHSYDRFIDILNYGLELKRNYP
jgi:4-amino-4-deoxy-L-arabinose transferase-like glycosyltransferase